MRRSCISVDSCNIVVTAQSARVLRGDHEVTTREQDRTGVAGCSTFGQIVEGGSCCDHSRARHQVNAGPRDLRLGCPTLLQYC